MLQLKFDMLLPKTCMDCPFNISQWSMGNGHLAYICMFTKRESTITKRQCKCPLVEVKEKRE